MRKLIIATFLLPIIALAQNVMVVNPTSRPVPVQGSNVIVNTTVDLSHIIGLPGATPSPSPAKAMVVQGIAGATPVITSGAVVAGVPLTAVYSASHITTNATTTITSATAYLSSVVVTCTAAGTTETIVIKNKEGTAKVLYQSPTLAVGTVTFSFFAPLLMTSGIDITTAGGGAATVDVYLTYFQ